MIINLSFFQLIKNISKFIFFNQLKKNYTSGLLAPIILFNSSSINFLA